MQSVYKAGITNVKLKQVYLSAHEPEGLARFYEALGLPIRFADAGKWVQFSSEKVAFCIAGPTESVSSPARGAVLVYETEDMEAMIEKARASGAEVSGDIRDMGSHGRTVQVQDPQGNVIQFYQAASG
jgi:predicted enzyme related to lactoylglutathione lyase